MIQHCFGYKAMYGGVTGKKEYNTAVGFQSLYQITTGDNNTALGHNVDGLITTGSKNVLIAEMRLELMLQTRYWLLIYVTG